MAIQDTLLFLGLLLTLALLLEPLAQRLHLPFPALLVLAGFIGSEVLVASGFDTGVRFDSFHDLVFYVFLPLLVFAGAFALDLRALGRDLLPILFLAGPVMLLSVLLSAVLIYFGIGHPTGFPWIAALLTGALLSATDPMAVMAILERAGAPQRSGLLLDGESLFNDAVAIVLFALVLEMALSGSKAIHLEAAGWHFLQVFFGGLAVGGLSGLLFLGLSRLLRAVHQQVLLTLICAYASYLGAETWLHVSGVMAVLAAGMVLGGGLRRFGEAEPRKRVQGTWQLLSFIAGALVFLLVGVTVTLAMFEERWLAMLIGIGGVLVARAAGVYLGLPLVGLLPGVQAIRLGERTLLFWGGVRGAVTLALALSLPVELDYWWTVQSIAFGVVLFTLFVQAPTLPLVMGKGHPPG